MLLKNLEEITVLEGIKGLVISDENDHFEALLVNRNKVNSEAKLLITLKTAENRFRMMYAGSGENSIIAKINAESGNVANRVFSVSNDEFT